MAPILIFCLSYLGIALGGIPGMAIDRVGIALLGAMAMVLFGVLSPEGAVGAIDWATIVLLYALMMISAQLRLGGFYTRLADQILGFLDRPRFFLFLLMAVAAFLSALLANDIICFAFTPVLAYALVKARLNPLPFLLGLATASNIGSAATIIGNPQNMLIGQMGRLDFGHFILWCGPPSLLSLGAAYMLILGIYGKRLYDEVPGARVQEGQARPVFNAWQTGKGIFAILVLVILFFTPLPREMTAIAMAGALLCSRKMRTRDILGLVDWHLITLFIGLFIIIAGMARAGVLDRIMAILAQTGWNLSDLSILSGVSVILSNLVSNVPAVMLLTKFLDPSVPEQWYALALSSTLAGNLFLLGSIANLIVVEQASHFGIGISFRQHAVVGIPVTLVSLAIMMGWLFL
jgi:Na+/H+ antiporter NhaD/arsenite permease-like protein